MDLSLCPIKPKAGHYFTHRPVAYTHTHILKRTYFSTGPPVGFDWVGWTRQMLI